MFAEVMRAAALKALVATALFMACQPKAEGMPAANATAPARSIFRTSQGEIALQVEIANTNASRAQGLMHRRSLPADAGMVFVFAEESPRTFWMKNTYIPLDMIFVAADMRVVGIVANAEPLTLEPRGVPAASKYVVEANGGFAARHGIATGTMLRLEGVPRVAE